MILDAFADNYIVDAFICDFDKSFSRSNNFVHLVGTDSLSMDGCCDNYLKHMFNYAMHLLVNFDNHYAINVLDF